jgi:hypothetical protein
MPFPGFLTDFAKPCQIVTTTAGAAAATDITTSAVDMADYEGCLFLVAFGAIVTNAVTAIKLQQSDDDGSSDGYSDIVGTGQTVADDDDNTSFVIDFRKPQKRYLKLIVTRATQNATVGAVYAIPYNKGSRSDLSAAGTAISGAERFINVAEGTA